VSPGKFRLFSQPNHVPNPECEIFADLEIKANGQAHLTDGLGGRCALTALFQPNPRDYTLRVQVDACGTKTYEGSRRVAIDPSTTGLATIKITDQRADVCMHVALPAQVVVDETVPGYPGPITQRMYSADEAAPQEHAVLFCREAVDHGAEITFFAAGPQGKLVRAEYTETTIVKTEVVASMDDCRDAAAVPMGIPDMLHLSTTCKDAGAYAVELYDGGFAGIPQAKLWALGAGDKRTLVTSLPCHPLSP
jgi:hypothetical protein